MFNFNSINAQATLQLAQASRKPANALGYWSNIECGAEFSNMHIDTPSTTASLYKESGNT